MNCLACCPPLVYSWLLCFVWRKNDTNKAKMQHAMLDSSKSQMPVSVADKLQNWLVSMIWGSIILETDGDRHANTRWEKRGKATNCPENVDKYEESHANWFWFTPEFLGFLCVSLESACILLVEKVGRLNFSTCCKTCFIDTVTHLYGTKCSSTCSLKHHKNVLFHPVSL